MAKLNRKAEVSGSSHDSNFSLSPLCLSNRKITNTHSKIYALREFPLIEKINVNRKVIKRFIY